MNRAVVPQGHANQAGCGCVPAPAGPDAQAMADVMQARAIAAGLAEFGIGPTRWSATYDHAGASAVLRVDTPRGLYVLVIPAPGQPFPVRHRGQRVGALDCRRTHGTADSYTAALFAMFLRERAALEIPGKDVCSTPGNMV